jgi:hypothetical protein
MGPRKQALAERLAAVFSRDTILINRASRMLEFNPPLYHFH